LTTETSIQPIRFDLPDVPGPVAALRLAMAQADARQNAHSFISHMLGRLEKAGVSKETRVELHDLAEAMLLDEAMEPYAIFSGARSCLSRELICPDHGDAAAIDEIYGEGFAAALCASVPDGYPRPAGTVRGDGGIPAKYTVPFGEWADALSVGAFPAGQSRCLRPCAAGGRGESR
jgi:hypothetical protein